MDRIDSYPVAKNYSSLNSPFSLGISIHIENKTLEDARIET
jgi:hypothetical protein